MLFFGYLDSVLSDEDSLFVKSKLNAGRLLALNWKEEGAAVFLKKLPPPGAPPNCETDENNAGGGDACIG